MVLARPKHYKNPSENDQYNMTYDLDSRLKNTHLHFSLFFFARDAPDAPQLVPVEMLSKYSTAVLIQLDDCDLLSGALLDTLHIDF